MSEFENSASFELVNYSDLYHKAQHDLAKLDKLVNSYDLFNFLCTINHIHDWATKDVNLTNVQIPNNTDGTLNIIRLLCNRAKHFKKRQVDLNTDVKKGFGAGRYGVGPFGIGEPSYMVTIDGNDVSVLQVCKDALGIWADFIANNPH